ncbi:MAG: helix-turn-helix transcriptional regulator [Rhodospirillales bacterium]|nr:helix-turn-helix transcriptional regulator [Rhodospirillales bacterium]MCB9965180.1 helix-turn-helix transcriptional regulator [Rhodospirillales bacterium]MCB9973199.1 helix-turn-helix transcriptional regulator [Rhodospirillales bacterium]MCB9979541.1 helix-turn-helix transcriptional regulator [Rhodospirillales bacterium]
MNDIKIHTIIKEGYHLSSVRVDEGVDYIERAQAYKTPTRVLDIYPDFWMLYLFDLPKGQLSLHNGKSLVEVSGPKALYVPPYSLIDKHFSSGWAQWRAYSCFRPPAPHFPKRPVCFSWDKNWRVYGFSDISEIFKKDLNLQPVGRAQIAPLIVDRTCDAIKETYKETLSIEELANLLGVPHSSMTHAFKYSLGLSPIAYRNRVRVFDSLRRISLGESVTQSCHGSGFANYSRFYRNFSEILEVSPSDFARRGFSYRGQDVPLKDIRSA